MARVVAQLAAHVTQQRPVAPPDLLLFVGSVRWRRRQLLHDVSRGRWGLCRAVVADILSDAPLEDVDGTARLAPPLVRRLRARTSVPHVCVRP